MEARVHALIEASARAAASGDAVMCLERAKEAGRRERALAKFKDGAGLGGDEKLMLDPGRPAGAPDLRKVAADCL